MRLERIIKRQDAIGPYLCLHVPGRAPCLGDYGPYPAGIPVPAILKDLTDRGVTIPSLIPFFDATVPSPSPSICWSTRSNTLVEGEVT